MSPSAVGALTVTPTFVKGQITTQNHSPRSVTNVAVDVSDVVYAMKIKTPIMKAFPHPVHEQFKDPHDD
jgi:hypothetical protein